MAGASSGSVTHDSRRKPEEAAEALFISGAEYVCFNSSVLPILSHCIASSHRVCFFGGERKGKAVLGQRRMPRSTEGLFWLRSIFVLRKERMNMK